MSRIVAERGSVAKSMAKRCARDRSLGIRNVCVAVIVISFSLLLVWSHTRIVNIGYGISEANKEWGKLLQLNSELRLEIATLKSPHYVEGIAKKELRLRPPQSRQIIVIK